MREYEHIKDREMRGAQGLVAGVRPVLPLTALDFLLATPYTSHDNRILGTARWRIPTPGIAREIGAKPMRTRHCNRRHTPPSCRAKRARPLPLTQSGREGRGSRSSP